VLLGARAGLRQNLRGETLSVPDARIMVVDDSAVFRLAIKEALDSAAGMTVVGTASNGKLAIQKVEELQPDVVVLDVEMPVMDGIETLKVISKQFPKIHVIMFSAHTTRAAGMTIEALTAGAKGFVAKPRDGTPQQNMDVIGSELLPLIRSLVGSRFGGTTTATPSPASIPSGTKLADPAMLKMVRRHVIAIGISTGGPNALQRLIPALPANIGVPILIVQHMPPVFTAQLAERLTKHSSIEVVEAQHHMPVIAGKAYIAPGDFHMVIEGIGSTGVRIALNQSPRESGCRPSVDPLFRSVAQVWGKNAVGVIMTGMGADGTLGVEAMRGKGAAIVAQDMESSVVWGMPGSIVEKGLADLVLPLDSIAPTLVDLTMGGR